MAKSLPTINENAGEVLPAGATTATAAAEKRAKKRVDTEKQDTGGHISAQRELSPEEESSLAAGKKRWLPRIFQSYGTPIPELMASPAKTGLIFGLPAGLIGAGIGSAFGGALANRNNSTTGALIGGLGLGGAAAILASMHRDAQNEGLEELMRRLPENAAKRDLISDPQYQKDFLKWDDSQIVAHARARYYRPTERFGSSNMQGGRAKRSAARLINNKDKTTMLSTTLVPAPVSEKNAFAAAAMGPNIYPGNKALHKALRAAAMNYLGAGAGIGAGAGALYGALTSPNMLKGLGRGALTGAGTGLGIAAAAPFGLYGGARGGRALGAPGWGGAVGLGAGGALGGVAGHATGNALADLFIGRAADGKSDAKKQKEKEEKEARAILNNDTLSLAEKMAAYSQLMKQANPSATMGAILGAGAPAVVSNSSVPANFNPDITFPVTSPTTGRPMFPRTGGSKSVFPPPGASPAGPVTLNAGSDGVPVNSATGAPGLPSVPKKMPREQAKSLRDWWKSKTEPVGDWVGENVLFPMSQMHEQSFKNKTTPPPPEDSSAVSAFFDKIMKSPYTPYALGGAGLVGGGGLAYLLGKHLSKKKKKKKPQSEDGSMKRRELKKAANAPINWYAVAHSNSSYDSAKTASIAGVAHNAVKLVPVVAKSPAVKTLLRRLGLTTLGVGAAAGTGLGIGNLINSFGKKPEPSTLSSMYNTVANSPYTPYALGGVGALGALGGAAYMGYNTESDKKKKKREKRSDLQFGPGLGAGAGAGLGVLGGGLYGLLSDPGEDIDAAGRRKKRSRIMAALRGALGGGLLGGGAGAAVGALSQSSVGDVLRKYLGGGKAEGPPTVGDVDVTPATLRQNPSAAQKDSPAGGGISGARPIKASPQNASATLGGTPAAPIDDFADSMPPVSPSLTPEKVIPSAPIMRGNPTSGRSTAETRPGY